jgi:hypothetical protein
VSITETVPSFSLGTYAYGAANAWPLADKAATSNMVVCLNFMDVALLDFIINSPCLICKKARHGSGVWRNHFGE